MSVLKKAEDRDTHGLYPLRSFKEDIMKGKKVLNLIKESFSEWSRDNASRLSAALAFYTIFSLAPVLVIIVSVAGFILGSKARGEELIQQVGQFTGPQIANVLQGIEQHAVQQSSGLLAGIISVIVIIVGASGVFYELRQSLNTIWEVERKPGGGIMDFIKTRVTSFLFLFVIGILLFVTFAASAAVEALSSYMEGIIPASQYIIPAVNALDILRHWDRAVCIIVQDPAGCRCCLG